MGIQSPIMRLRHPAFAAAAAIALGGAAVLSLRAQQPAAPPANHRAGPARRPEESGAVADVFGRLHRPAPQPAEAADAAERGRARAAVDVSDRYSRLARTRHRELAASSSTASCTSPATTTRHGRSMRATGRPIWNYRRTLPANFAASVCCGPVNRGFAILGDRLYMGTLDAHLVALDRKTGSVIWDVAVGDLEEGQRHHGRAARRERQGDHRRRRRRLLEPRVHRRVRRADRRARCGASTRFPARASQAASRGRTPRWPRAAAARSGSPAATIRR